MDENPFPSDEAIAYFKNEIEPAESDTPNTIFLGAPKHTNYSLWLIFSIALGIYFILSTFVGNVLLMPITIEGSSMYPTLNYEYATTGNSTANDVVYLKKTQKVEYKDIVVFDATKYQYHSTQTASVYFIKRVIAVGGDTLQFVKTKSSSTGISTYKVVKNGILLQEDYVAESIHYSGSTAPQLVSSEQIISIPKGYIFVMGDNRNNSRDSRDLGLISIEDVVGKAVIHIPYGATLIEGVAKSIKQDLLF